MALMCRSGAPIYHAALKQGIPVTTAPFLSPLDWNTVSVLARYVIEHQVDVIHSHSSVDGWCAALAAVVAGVPVVRSRHISAPLRNGILTRWYYTYLVDHVITSAEAIRQRMTVVNGLDPDRIVAVPAGANEHRFRTGVDPSRVRDELGFPRESFVVGIVAVLRSWKGHKVLFEAVRKLREQIPTLRLLVVGDGPYKEELVKWAQELEIRDWVTFTGFREDVPELLSLMNVFVLPSTGNEGTSQVIPQAMLCGVPVVASTAGGLTEVVRHRETGLLVPPGDPVALADAVYALYKEPSEAARLVDAALREAREHWTLEDMIRKTDSVYSQVVRENPDGSLKSRVRRSRLK